jgi:ribose transport system permease protein
MKKLLGIALFLLLLYAALMLSDPGARSVANHFNLGRRIGLYGIVTLGAGLLIISGGIDLSIGSVVGLCSTLLAMLLRERGWPPLLAILAILLLGGCIGLVHGLLVTKLRVQAFVVTLCGLFIYRGLARWVSDDQPKGLGNEFVTWRYWLYSSRDLLGLPMALVFLALLAVVAAVFLHGSVYGRYLSAIGNNERAVRYSGIAVDRYKVLAYVLCSGLAACFGVLYLMQENSIQPSETGTFLELYAIAGAVLGGCSLRGGEGTVLGILIGTAILRVLQNLVNMWGIPSALEFTVIGAALLLGAILDELLRRRRDRRPAPKTAAGPAATASGKGVEVP